MSKRGFIHYEITLLANDCVFNMFLWKQKAKFGFRNIIVEQTVFVRLNFKIISQSKRQLRVCQT